MQTLVGEVPRHGEQTRDDLLDSAEELFSHFGVEGTSIRAVNANAGAGPSSSPMITSATEMASFAVVINRRGKAVLASQFDALDVLGASRCAAIGGGRRRGDEPSVDRGHREGSGRRTPMGQGHRVACAVARSVVGSLDARPGGLNDRFERQIRRALPDVSDELLLANWQLAGSALLRLFADCDSAAGSTSRSRLVVAPCLFGNRRGLCGSRSGVVDPTSICRLSAPTFNLTSLARVGVVSRDGRQRAPVRS